MVTSRINPTDNSLQAANNKGSRNRMQAKEIKTFNLGRRNRVRVREVRVKILTDLTKAGAREHKTTIDRNSTGVVVAQAGQAEEAEAEEAEVAAAEAVVAEGNFYL